MFQNLLLLVPKGHLEAVQTHSLLHREGKDVPEVTQCVTYSCCCLRPQIILDRLTFQFLMSRSGLQALGPADSLFSFACHESDNAHMARAHGPAIFWEQAAGLGPKGISGLLSFHQSCVANRKTKEVGVRSHPNNFRSLKRSGSIASAFSGAPLCKMSSDAGIIDT